MNHTDLLQQLIKGHSYKSYLEIGYGQGVNFNAIEVDKKVAVDPNMNFEGFIEGCTYIHETSDTYFGSLDGRTKFDIAFIDGDHHANQVERDIVNAWQHLKKGGALVIHDVWPENEEMTRVPRETKVWCGTVFKAFHGLLDKYPSLDYIMDTEDFGTAVIMFDKDIKIEPGFISDVSFEEYVRSFI